MVRPFTMAAAEPVAAQHGRFILPPLRRSTHSQRRASAVLLPAPGMASTRSRGPFGRGVPDSCPPPSTHPQRSRRCSASLRYTLRWSGFNGGGPRPGACWARHPASAVAHASCVISRKGASRSSSGAACTTPAAAPSSAIAPPSGAGGSSAAAGAARMSTIWALRASAVSGPSRCAADDAPSPSTPAPWPKKGPPSVTTQRLVPVAAAAAASLFLPSTVSHKALAASTDGSSSRTRAYACLCSFSAFRAAWPTNGPRSWRSRSSSTILRRLRAPRWSPEAGPLPGSLSAVHMVRMTPRHRFRSLRCSSVTSMAPIVRCTRRAVTRARQPRIPSPSAAAPAGG